MDFSFLIPPVVGSIIGYTTNWLAIKMLFKPYSVKYIGPFKIPFTPGVIPRERQRIAKSLGQAVGGQLLSEEVILGELTGTSVSQQLKDYILNDLLAGDLTIDQVVTALAGQEEEKEALYAGLSRFLTDRLFDKEGKSRVSHLVETHQEDISAGILTYLQKEETKEALSTVIQDLLSEKLGGMAAMFVQGDQVYGMFLDYMEVKLEKAETQAQLAQVVGQVAGSVLTKDMVEGEVRAGLHSLAKESIELSDPAKLAIEKAIESAYIHFVKNHLPAFIKELNVSSIVENQINTFSVQEVEKLIFNIVDKELKAITWFGALLGFIMGWLTLLG